MVSAEPGRRRLFRRPRITFAARLLLGGFVLSLAIIAVVSAFLLVSRDQQTRVGAETNAESRAQAYRELVQQVAAPQARFAAQNVAALPEMATALSASDPQTTLAPLLTGSTKVITDLPNETVAVFDASGTLLATSEQSGVPQLTSAQPEVEGALSGKPAEAIDLLNARTPVYDFAAPVMATGSSQVLGAVVYSMPITDQLLRLLGAVGQGYTPVILANQPGAALYAISGNPADPTLSAETLPSSIGNQLGRSGGSFAGYSSVPRSGDTAFALEGMNPNAGPPVLYVGVETPISLFIGDQTTDELTVVWLALTALLVTWLLVLLFVNRFVRRPVAQLSAGVARIAGGTMAPTSRCGPVTSWGCWPSRSIRCALRSRATSATSTPRCRAWARSPGPSPPRPPACPTWRTRSAQRRRRWPARMPPLCSSPARGTVWW